MWLQISLLVLGFLKTDPAASYVINCTEFQNGNNYSAYESMLLADEMNLMELEKGFFPTNYHPSVVVDVEYHFVHVSSEEKGRREVEVVGSEVQIHNDDDVMQQQDKEPLLNLTAAEFSRYQFRWAISPINLFIRPGLLTTLSLNAFQTRNASIYLSLGLPFTCLPQGVNSSVSTCDHPPPYLEQLNTLTANVSFSHNNYVGSRVPLFSDFLAARVYYINSLLRINQNAMHLLHSK